MSGTRVIVAGATGTVGGIVLRLCRDDLRVARMTVLGRSPTRLEHAKLREVVHGDGRRYESVAAGLENRHIRALAVTAG